MFKSGHFKNVPICPFIIKEEKDDHCSPYFSWCISKRNSWGEWDYNECDGSKAKTGYGSVGRIFARKVC